MFRQVFRRREDDVVEIRSPSALPEEHRKEARKSREKELGFDHYDGDGTVQEKTVITNRSRKADGPDTPLPFPGFARTAAELVAQAKKGVGIKSRSDKRRDDLKSRIRVISEGESERAAVDTTKKDKERGKKWF